MLGMNALADIHVPILALAPALVLPASSTSAAKALVLLDAPPDIPVLACGPVLRGSSKLARPPLALLATAWDPALLPFSFSRTIHVDGGGTRRSGRSYRYSRTRSRSRSPPHVLQVGARFFVLVVRVAQPPRRRIPLSRVACILSPAPRSAANCPVAGCPRHPARSCLSLPPRRNSFVFV
jgi:hypothetical protein